MVSFIIWLVVGGLIGWVASMVMHTKEGVILNIIVGIVGAMIGGWLLSPYLGANTINQSNFSPMALLVSFFGAVLLLAAVNLIRRGALR